MISFNEPVNISKGMEYINKVIQENKRLNGDGEYTKRCSEWLEKNFHAKKVQAVKLTKEIGQAKAAKELGVP